MVLAGPEVLAVLPQPLPCSLHYPLLGGGEGQTPLSSTLPGSWGSPSVDSGLPSFLSSFLPMPLGLRPLPLNPEDCGEWTFGTSQDIDSLYTAG